MKTKEMEKDEKEEAEEEEEAESKHVVDGTSRYKGVQKGGESCEIPSGLLELQQRNVFLNLKKSNHQLS